MLFKEIYDDLKQKIETGVYVPGSSLPSEVDLQRIYRVSRTTVRNATAKLVKEKRVIRKKGSGLFVAPATSKQNILNMTGIIRPTYLESSDTVKVKDSYLRLVGPYYAELFGLSSRELLYYVSFLTTTTQGRALEKLLLPLAIFPDFDPACLKVTPIIEVVNSGKLNLQDVYQDFQLVEATDESSKQLALARNAPLFKITNLFSAENGQKIAVEYREQGGLSTEYSIDFS